MATTDAQPSAEMAPMASSIRPISFAIWWKLTLIILIYCVVPGFIIGFLGYVLPFGQIQFWLVSVLVNVGGGEVAEFLLKHSDALWLALGILYNVMTFFLLFVALHWLLTKHAGRVFGGSRLVLQRTGATP